MRRSGLATAPLPLLAVGAGGAVAAFAALVLLPLPAAALLSGGGILALLTLIDPVWGLSAAVLSVTVQETVLLPGDVTFTQTAMLLLAGSYALWVLAWPSRPVRFGRLFLPLVVLVWFLALSATFTPYSQIEGIKETLRWSLVVLVYLVSFNTLLPHYDAPSPHATAFWRIGVLVLALLLATSVNAGIGLWQFATGDGPESFAIAGGRFVRAYGTIGHPNSFAGYLNMGLPLALALGAGAGVSLLRGWRGLASLARLRYIGLLVVAAGGSLLLGGALLASYSRGGWVGAAGGIAAMGGVTAIVFFRNFARNAAARRSLWRWGGVALAGGGLLLVAGSAGIRPDTLANRVASIARNIRLFDVRSVQVTPENFAVVERMSHLQAAYAMMLHHPLTGVGAGNYTSAYEGSDQFRAVAYALHPWYTSQGHAHNTYLHIAAETGLGGLAAYLALLVLLGYQAWKTIHRVDHWFFCSVATGCCGIIGSVAVHNLFEHLHVLNMGVQLGAVWGLLSVLENVKPDNE